jgi:hypothetical protein
MPAAVLLRGFVIYSCFLCGYFELVSADAQLLRVPEMFAMNLCRFLDGLVS